MGPVGILCVQRTLDKGRHTGLYTGIGAAISDLIYCLLTGFGLSFIEEFLERNSNIIQLIGSVVLIGFGVYLFKSNPSRQLKKPSEQRIPAGKNILNGFLFTFSNPLIIFLIIGLFARFNFLLPEIKFYHYIIGYLAIFGGALLWWYFVTYFVDKVRAHFNLRSMWLINKIIGSVIFLFAIVGIIGAASGLASASNGVVYMNKTRGFGEFENATDSTLTISAGEKTQVKDLIYIDCGNCLKWEFRAEATGKKPCWRMILKNKERELGFEFSSFDSRFEETYTSPYMLLRVYESGKVLSERKIFDKLNISNRENAYRFVSDNSGWAIYGGNRAYNLLASEAGKGFIPDSIGFMLEKGKTVEISDMAIEISNLNPIGAYDAEVADIDSIEEYLRKSSDPKEGLWAVYDRTLEDNYLRMGGDYRLAILRNGEDYDIIYLQGAEKNPGAWKSGMLKGRLKASAFKDVYDVEWIDSAGEKCESIKAQYEADLFRFVFIDLSSELRLAKIEN